MPFIPRELRQYRAQDPAQQWLGQLRSGNRMTASLPLLDATGSFTERIAAPGSGGWRDIQAAGAQRRAQSGSYNMPQMSQRTPTRGTTPSQRVPAVASVISSLRPRGEGFMQEVAKGPIDSPLGGAPIGSVYPGAGTNEYLPMSRAVPSASQDRTDVGDGDGGGFLSGVGDYLGGPGIGQAMTAAGGAMMEAAGRPGASFGGSLGTGLQGFAAERARFQTSEAARQQAAQKTATGVTGRVSTVTAMLDQAGITDPTERARALEMAKTVEGYRVITGQLEVRLTGAQEATLQEASVAGLLDLLEITDPETRASFNNLPKATAVKILEDQYASNQDGAAGRGVKVGEWEYYQNMLREAAGDPIKIGEAEKFWSSTQTRTAMGNTERIEQRVYELGDPDWVPGTPMNAAQMLVMSLQTGMPTSAGGYFASDAEKEINSRLTTEVFDWKSGGETAFISQLEKFTDILVALDEPGAITGGAVGLMDWILPEALFELLNIEATNARDLISSVVYESLRETLGAQFTQREGERLVAASYNMRLPEEMNKIRIERLKREVQRTAGMKNRMSDWYDNPANQRSFINFDNPWTFTEEGGVDTIAMAHLLVRPEDYDVLTTDGAISRAIEQDVGSFTQLEAERMLLDLADDQETDTVMEMRRQLRTKLGMS
jgi:hypothetical protein